MGWLIAAAALLLLGTLPLDLCAEYGDSGGKLWFRVAGIQFPLYPRNSSDKEEKPPEQFEKKKMGRTVQRSNKSRGPLSDFLPLVQILFDFLKEFRRKIRIRVLRVHLVMAEDDPCNLAVHYGDAWVVLSAIIPGLEHHFVIRKKEVSLQCDFTADTPTVYAFIHITITLGRFLYHLIRHGLRGVFKFIEINNKRKGGAAK